jgi:hypothetical protein
VTLTPVNVEPGSPQLIVVHQVGATAVEGEWFGHQLRFSRVAAYQGQDKNSKSPDSDSWYVLAGVDVEAEAVPVTLRITAHLASGETRELTRNVVVHPAHYTTGKLSVPPRYVTPGTDELKLIEAASKAKEKAFATTAGEPLWSGSFEAPVKAPPTDSFGTRRMFNGKLASIHKGTDFKAATGTPVRAGNAGKVILAQPLYYEGNCVMIDHGLGLVSISMHLSRIDVRAGQAVAKGEQIGLSGATGRVTGPHLHWAIRWQGAYLDPAKLLRMHLDGLQ